MSLTPGVRFGPYEIVAAAGAGGMGEVYRARDTRLDRTVALKILPVADPDRRARFEREARSVAALSHPHICTLHDVGRHDGIDYLVMEFVDGVTLASRLAGGTLPIDEALRIGIEVAGALDHAHRHGIVHRDLKPGNIMLARSGKTASGASHAKLLDFGLAKAMASEAGGAGASAEATPTGPLTTEGSLLGTLQYMSPEQIEGVGVDARSDLFAFGAVLFEMLTGRKPFTGTTQAALIGAILREDPPPVSALQPRVPPALDRLVARCLAKSPDDRWQTARDLLAELQWIAAAPLAEPRETTPGRQHAGWRAAGAVAGVVIAASAAAFFAGSRSSRPLPVDIPPQRLTIVPPRDPGNINPAQRLALSPDGQRLAYVTAGAGGRSQLWLRALGELTPRPLEGAAGPRAPFWSPDGRFVAFQSMADNSLKKIAADGGPAIPVCDLPSGLTADRATSGSWSADGVILFAVLLPNSRIYRVSAEGGVPVPALELDTANGEAGQVYPSFLPDGRHFLYLSLNATNDPRGVWLASLDDPDRTLVLPAAANTTYAMEHLLYMQGNLLMAQPFDPRTRTTTGNAAAVAGPLQLGGVTGRTGGFAVSNAGSLAYIELPSQPRSRLAWFSRDGRELGTMSAEPDAFDDLELSPDRRRALVSIVDPDRGSRDLWVLDTESKARTRLTTAPDDEGPGVWAPDGERVVFATTRKDRAASNRDLTMRSVAGGGETVLGEKQDFRLGGWSAADEIVYTDALTGFAWFRQPKPGAQPSRYDGPGIGRLQLSPDSRWLAYAAGEPGRVEVYVSAFPTPQGRRQVSGAGGNFPRWSRDGRELFFLSGQNELMSAPVAIEAGRIAVGAPKALFSIQPSGRRVGYPYDVTADERFLVNVGVEPDEPITVTLLTNWPALLRQ